MLAAMVRAIDGEPLTFPQDRESLDGLLDRLGPRGIVAACEALSKMITEEGLGATWQ